MSETLMHAMCRLGLAHGGADCRRYITTKSVTVNGELATSYDQIVHVGDVIKLGKRRTGVV